MNTDTSTYNMHQTSLLLSPNSKLTSGKVSFLDVGGEKERLSRIITEWRLVDSPSKEVTRAILVHISADYCFQLASNSSELICSKYTGRGFPQLCRICA